METIYPIDYGQSFSDIPSDIPRNRHLRFKARLILLFVPSFLLSSSLLFPTLSNLGRYRFTELPISILDVSYKRYTGLIPESEPNCFHRRDLIAAYRCKPCMNMCHSEIRYNMSYLWRYILPWYSHHILKMDEKWIKTLLWSKMT